MKKRRNKGILIENRKVYALRSFVDETLFPISLKLVSRKNKIKELMNNNGKETICSALVKCDELLMTFYSFLPDVFPGIH